MEFLKRVPNLVRQIFSGRNDLAVLSDGAIYPVVCESKQNPDGSTLTYYEYKEPIVRLGYKQ